MKLIRALSLSMIIALPSASAVHADTPPNPPAKKEAPTPPEKKPKELMAPNEVKMAEEFVQAIYDAVMKTKNACPNMGAAIDYAAAPYARFLMRVANKDLPQDAKDKLKKKWDELFIPVLRCLDPEKEKETKSDQAARDKIKAALNKLGEIPSLAAEARPSPNKPATPPTKK